MQDELVSPGGGGLRRIGAPGGNGRTCLTCHMPETGTITLEDIARRVEADG